MTNKVQELTDKIYNEGIKKAKTDAEKIITEAKTEANKIVRDAQEQHEELLSKTDREITEIKKHSNSEMQLAARQFLSHIKQQITNIITSAQVEAPVNEAFNDSEFLKKLILILILLASSLSSAVLIVVGVSRGKVPFERALALNPLFKEAAMARDDILKDIRGG